jgi:hypothetical protein
LTAFRVALAFIFFAGIPSSFFFHHRIPEAR